MNLSNLSRILLIQTAYIGDVILMTPLLENLKRLAPQADIDILVNRNNASVLSNHPKINELLLWNKKERKNQNLIRLLQKVRKKKYQIVINCHRFASSGIITALSGAQQKIGFDTNPMARWYDQRVPHALPSDLHEVDRNLALLKALMPELEDDNLERRPKLYPSETDYQIVLDYQTEPYLCIAPTSVWFTKQFPAERWVELLRALKFEGKIYLLGGPDDRNACEGIKQESQLENVINMSGQLSLLQSAVLMKGAILNYVNDSAPLHLASAMNAPVCAVFCSTIPDFGFTPLSDFSEVVDINGRLTCRPCGIHGHRACPEKHFRCAYDITLNQLIKVFEKVPCPQ
uniref:Glycosyltransferase family 9 protein n=1 Tax=Roseihalotalea indica TaxID=2867963 RepID=A0AA49JGF5_9BACT|nr:glycosyltransferase family 9 protein [Tunicatimonas sp. TK19036]